MAQKKTYSELTEHDSLQKTIFSVMVILSIIVMYFATIQLLEEFFVEFLNGVVYNDGSEVSYSLEKSEPVKKTNYFYSWAIDIFVNTPEEARYWFNPLLSIFIPAALISVFISVILTAIFPQNIGFMRQKIQREIVNMLDKIALIKYGYHAEEHLDDIAKEIMESEVRDLRDYEELWKIPTDDLKMLYSALKWNNSSAIYRLTHIANGLRIYMKTYFTSKYHNTVLGFVYIGAAILIIIIGLRGLKFIPSTQPSIILFALGLEFSLLIVYAFTLMYTREDGEEKKIESDGRKRESLMSNGNFANTKEIESLLRVFLKKDKKRE